MSCTLYTVHLNWPTISIHIYKGTYPYVVQWPRLAPDSTTIGRSPTWSSSSGSASCVCLHGCTRIVRVLEVRCLVPAYIWHWGSVRLWCYHRLHCNVSINIDVDYNSRYYYICTRKGITCQKNLIETRAACSWTASCIPASVLQHRQSRDGVPWCRSSA